MAGHTSVGHTPRWHYVVTSAPESWEMALGDIQRADLSARIIESLAPGLFVVQSEFSPARLGDALWAQGVFVRHVFPILETVDCCSYDKAAIIQAATCLGRVLDPTKTVSVQTRVMPGVGMTPYDLNTPVAEALTDRGFAIDVKHPDQAVSILCGPSKAYVGASSVKDNLSDWAGGARRFAHDPQSVSRAEFKLLEAVELFSIALPKAGRALDLGAAPGGWTHILSDRGLQVVAVDPARLDDRVSEIGLVTHIRATVQVYLSRHVTGPEFDLIVNDMKMDAGLSARMLGECARLMKPDGASIMTLKLKAKHPHKQIKGAVQILSRHYRVVGLRQLFHNRREVTVYLRRRSLERS